MMKFNDTVTRLFEVREQMKDLAEVEQALAADLKEQVKAGETHEVGDLELVVGHNRRFNPKKAATWLSDAERKTVEETTISATKFKALYPELYEQAQDEHAPKITVRVREGIA